MAAQASPPSFNEITQTSARITAAITAPQNKIRQWVNLYQASLKPMEANANLSICLN